MMVCRGRRLFQPLIQSDEGLHCSDWSGEVRWPGHWPLIGPSLCPPSQLSESSLNASGWTCLASSDIGLTIWHVSIRPTFVTHTNITFFQTNPNLVEGHFLISLPMFVLTCLVSLSAGPGWAYPAVSGWGGRTHPRSDSLYEAASSDWPWEKMSSLYLRKEGYLVS